MEINIKKYTRITLSDYLDSDEYRNSEIWPISFHRALSHMNNPRLDDNDVILTIAEKDGLIVGYRTVMADWAFNEDKKIKVGWISGTWVEQEYRRQGLATKLFDEIYSEWKGRLMYTNYAPASKKVYDKTGVFEVYASHSGCRFHMKSNMAEILPSRFPALKAIKKLLPTADNFFNHYVLPFLTEPGMKSRLSYSFIIKSKLNSEELDLLFSNTLTKRSEKEFNWILNFPWVKEISQMDEGILRKYFFSAAADVFKQYFIIVYKRGVLVSIVMFTIKNTQMKVPYYYSQDMDVGLIADLVFKEAWKNGVSYIDIYNENLTGEMKLKTAYYAFSKNRERNYMVSKDIIQEFPDANTVKVPDGEGDVVFV